MDNQVKGAVSWHDDIAENFDAGYDRSPAFKQRALVWQRLIAAHVSAGGRVLDAGCGPGVFSFMAARQGADVTAIDGSANMIAICKREQERLGLSSITFSEAMLDSLATWPDGGFDAVLSSSVLEYVPGYQAVMVELARLLAPGGRLIVSMPNRRSLYRKAERIAFKLTGRPRYYAHVVNLADERELTTALQGAGLDVVETCHFADAPVLGSVFNLAGDARSKSLLVMVARKPL